jgi:hypothetical protein
VVGNPGEVSDTLPIPIFGLVGFLNPASGKKPHCCHRLHVHLDSVDSTCCCKRTEGSYTFDSLRRLFFPQGFV